MKAKWSCTEKSTGAVAVHSSAHDKRRKKRIDRELKADRKEIESELEKLSKEKLVLFQIVWVAEQFAIIKPLLVVIRGD